MYKKGFVSVVIPCYNCASVMDETIESLENQTSNSFEVICVNDGSTDNTLDVLKKWKAESRLDITIINQANGGVSKARNVGIDAAQGEYLLFLDSDDIYNRFFVEKLSLYAENYDVCFCKLSRKLENISNFEAADISFLALSQQEAMHKLLYEMGSYGFYCYLYKKQLLDEFNIRFDENTHRFEDREFNWKYLCHCNNILWLDAPLYGYRINALSVTQQRATWQTESFDAVRRVEAYMENLGIPFAKELKSYLFNRMLWARAKYYAQSHRKDLFIRLGTEYDLKSGMKRTAKDNNKLVRIASLLYLIHPMLFYYTLAATKK